MEGKKYIDEDKKWLREIVEGVVEEKLKIDKMINKDLKEEWKM